MTKTAFLLHETSHLLAAHAATPDDTVRAAHATALTGELPEWVQLVPAGTFQGLDGRGPYHLEDPAAVIHLTREVSAGHDLPIDYGHALEVEGPAGDAAPAAGWITALETRDGSIWGRVEWTEDGARRVRGREFRFLSPVFLHDRQGRVKALLRAGLTNRPNLPQLRSINSRRPRGGQEDELSDTQKSLQSRIAVALGLPEDAAEDAILERCAAASTAIEGFTKVAQSVQLEADASADDVVKAIETRAAGPDPAQYVPRDQYEQVAHALQEAQRREGERLVDQAVREGKLVPAQRGWALAYHARDARGFEEFLAKQPVLVSGNSEAAGNPPATNSGELDDAAKAVCATLGLDTQDFIKNREG